MTETQVCSQYPRRQKHANCCCLQYGHLLSWKLPETPVIT